MRDFERYTSQVTDEISPEERQLQQEAVSYARDNKKRLAAELTDTTIYPAERDPVSVFMAGSPGAGKTEASKELLATFEGENGSKILRVDPDELRNCFPGYNGANAYLFQGAVSILVDRILDVAFRQEQSFLLDGTLAHLDKARENVERSLKKGRTVQILYVYLNPLDAWRFVQAREAMEGRRIPKERFIDQYFKARDVVNALKREFGPRIKVDLLIKPIDGSERLFHAGIDQIDYHVPEKYDRAALERHLK